MLGECPEGHAEEQEDVEGLYHLVDSELDYTRLPYHHRPRPIRLPQAQSHRRRQSTLSDGWIGNGSDPLMVDIGPQLDRALLIDDISHVTVHEVGMVSPLRLRIQEGFLLFGDDADLAVIIDDVEVSGLFEGAEGHVEDPFVFVVPA